MHAPLLDPGSTPAVSTVQLGQIWISSSTIYSLLPSICDNWCNEVLPLGLCSNVIASDHYCARLSPSCSLTADFAIAPLLPRFLDQEIIRLGIFLSGGSNFAHNADEHARRLGAIHSHGVLFWKREITWSFAPKLETDFSHENAASKLNLHIE